MELEEKVLSCPELLTLVNYFKTGSNIKSAFEGISYPLSGLTVLKG